MKARISRLACLAGLLPISAGAAFGLGGYALWFLFGCCVFMVVYALVVSIWIRGNVVVERIMSRLHITAGEDLEVTVTVRLPFSCPLSWVIVEERWRKETTGREQRFARLLFPRGSRELTYQYKLPCKARGFYRVGVSQVAVGDILNLSVRRMEWEEIGGAVIKVMPQPLAGSWYSGLSKGNASGNIGTIRDYVHGDPMRSIDWKSFARHGKLQTKEADVEIGQSLLVVIDTEGDQTEGFERRVGAAARIVAEAGRFFDEITLVCGENRCRFASNRADRHTETFDWLTRIEPLGTHPFREAMRAAVGSADTGTVVVGVIGQLDDERLIAINNHCRRNVTAELVYIPAGGVLSSFERRTLGYYSAAGWQVHAVSGSIAYG